MRRVDLDCTLSGHTRKQDRALICDSMTEMAERMDRSISSRPWGDNWLGHLSKGQAGTFLRNGEEARVTASDAFMSKLEDQFQFNTGRFRTIDAIAGGCPNVSAYIAGAPLNMRRRQRVADDLAPLTIVADTTSSGGVDNDALERRGAAILALVRILSGRRPVTLYAGAAMGNGRQSGDGINAVLTRIETAPLDLARAAFMLGHPGAARGVCYGLVVDEFQGSDGHIPWPFGDAEKARAYAPEFLARVFPGTEILYLPSVFYKDASIREPERWLTEHVAKFGGLDNAAMAA